MEASRDIGRLVEIMRALRSPDDGCPWDIEQTFDTIAPYTIEEAYEVADAIQRRDAEDLREELGDLLLQVVYHAQLAAEAQLFTFEDVVKAITTKMIRRHPHVFGDVSARTARSAKGQWERIKAEERAEKAARRAAAQAVAADGDAAIPEDWRPRPTSDATGLLDSVPNKFPALTEALKVQQKAATVGFDWDAAEPILAKIAEEIEEFRTEAAAADKPAMEAELGDLLFSVVNLARFNEIDPEAATKACVAKFRRRFGFIERRLRDENTDLPEATLERMEALWVEAKTLERHQPERATLISG
ncbi:nucleoside triphosphate pyrophosphohydrolase [Aureimonas leprariae]|uniref:Nucleoside triphosphate pyrophosphohydrolase n=1 Tax=Plantimonas leprariae TaxID=2615207 RepID=A0A7V7TXZ4_9HYPH|nr:nucleoside triphosphate pyrophosphohydrolase [Aureimonas leprariae]KAB0681756.1 nucleoside triphosphate pyrophosphohydrolase [Aureimonas leprariae]